MPVASIDGTDIAYDVAGTGPPVLLLHGFPQTRALWAEVAPRLARHYTVVTPDLRGYGESAKPPAGDNLVAYSFRAMAADQLGLMTALGFDRFHLVGHDRGGRTSYRMALDAPDAVASLTVMDIVPTDTLVAEFAYPVSKAYFHWSFLAQPAPFPERMIEADPDHFYEACLLGWGGARLSEFKQIDAYRKAWRDPAVIAGMTNDYRAAVTIDLEHDAADRGKDVDRPVLVLFGADGVMAKSFDIPATWADRFSNMTAKAMPGGHFFIDQHGSETAEALLAFLSEQTL
ncbi:MAG: alpha/beta hydrolase [Paracoccaceae bacterium]|nr:alpha/beta hydrolase [Paracoccaceae bacterium]